MRVDGRRERENDPQEDRPDERGEYVGDAAESGQRAGDVDEHGPPEEQPDRDEHGMLEMEEHGARDGRVVHRAEVDDVPRDEPHR